MKKLEVVIPDSSLQDMIDIIKELKGSGFSYYSLAGRGSTKESLNKFKFEVVVKDGQVDHVIRECLRRIGGNIKTGGKLFVSEVSNAVDLVSKKEGEDAI